MNLRTITWIIFFIIFLQMIVIYFYPEMIIYGRIREFYSIVNISDKLWQNFGTKINQFGSSVQVTLTLLNISFNETFHSDNCNFVTWSFNPSMGLGNRMFIYSTLYGVAKYNNKVPYISNYDYNLDKIFKVSILPRKLNPEPKFVDKNENGCCRFDPTVLNLECNQSVRVGGYRQSWRYFEKYTKGIKNEFKFLKHIEDTCMEKIYNISNDFNCSFNECVLIGVHMRRGDFTYPGKMEFGHSPATEEYFRKAINYCDNKFNSTSIIYVILGNDYDWNYRTTQNITDNYIVVLKPDSVGMDMCVLTKCNHTIASAGSFSWWAAFLTGGFVTYMKDQCRPGSSLCREFEFNDYINPAWNWVQL